MLKFTKITLSLVMAFMMVFSVATVFAEEDNTGEGDSSSTTGYSHSESSGTSHGINEGLFGISHGSGESYGYSVNHGGLGSALASVAEILRSVNGNVSMGAVSSTETTGHSTSGTSFGLGTGFGASSSSSSEGTNNISWGIGSGMNSFFAASGSVSSSQSVARNFERGRALVLGVHEAAARVMHAVIGKLISMSEK